MMLMVFLITCVVIQSHAQNWLGAENKAEEVGIQMEATAALVKYGYAPPSQIGQLVTGNSKVFQNDLKNYQEFFGIEGTGVLDVATRKMLKIPRCGDKDPQHGKRHRRYTHQGSSWENGLNMKLRWRLFNEGQTVSHEDAREILTRAFKLWSDQTNLKFTETREEDEPEIKIKFARYDHGDPYFFDGEGGTLAHGFYPHDNKGRSGDIHFDDDELFSANRKPKTGEKDFMWVAVHEIGHSIGLEHSRVRDAIMFPWYNPNYDSDIQLRYDDRLGIQLLYGGKSEPQPSTRAIPTNPPPTTAKPTTPIAIPKTDCKDKRRTTYCEKKMENCFLDESDWVDYMKRNCEMTCGYCVKIATIPPKPTAPECKNIGKDNWCARRDGDCNMATVKKLCQRNCRLCESNECFDRKSKSICKQFVRNKACQNKKAIAKKFCGKSCNLCA